MPRCAHKDRALFGRYAAEFRQLWRVRRAAQSLTFDEAYAFVNAEIGIMQKPEEVR